MKEKNLIWIHADERMPEPIDDPRLRSMENAVLLFTPVDGMVHVGWYLGTDYRGRPEWITATATDRSYQHCTKRVTQWMSVPFPEPFHVYR